ncbi:unnamed protein product [Bursaphelenchus okinawaensis]|uniref:Pseudouridine synthase RsuA/RluA-like domain-containing protein n=1 Tax=Bursaphelenchus okinawaensis TaxID=465554 RepID=A0A811K095_9BILA|nr:unnamed protein product [Bursaphelenchus okinawaensis]CAG9088774.1 unnamed protein product [Bursaphelenchus okinawaensis]
MSIDNNFIISVLHRLDRTTSGVLLFAKNQEADRFYTEMIKSRNVNKEYVCRVDGQFPTSSIVCDQPIGTLVVSMGIQCIRPDGKSAKSTFRRIWYDQTTNQSVVLVKIETGRTHQIRVHLQFLGYPIVDDLLYNCFVWGPEKGKNAEYGKDYEQLGIDVRERHKATLWQEEIDPDYDERILKAAQDPDVINLEPWDTQTLDEGPDYDPLSHFRMPLHCWRYETEKFTYKAPLPDWAWPPTEGVVADLDPEGLYDDAEKMRNSGQLEVVEKRTGAVGVLGGGNGGVGVPDGTISQDVVLESKSGAVSVSDSTISQDVVLESKNEETRVPDRTIGQEKVPEHLNEPVLESAGTRLQEGDIKVPEEKSDQIGALEALTTQEMTVDDSTKSKLSGTLGTEAGI